MYSNADKLPCDLDFHLSKIKTGAETPVMTLNFGQVATSNPNYD